MIAKNTEADVNVISLVGERGREVREFIENDLGAEGLKKSVVVVGTSTIRTLETVVVSGFKITPRKGWTDKFIYPPYEFKMSDMLITNFHQPQSTLMMLVSAYANKDFIMHAYKEAIKKKYRFYSYGDSMLIM